MKKGETTMFDNYSASDDLLAFLLGDITSTFLGATGLDGLSYGGGILPMGICKSGQTV